MNLFDEIETRVRSELARIEAAGARPVRTIPRWPHLELLPEIKKAFLAGQAMPAVDEAYNEYKSALPRNGVTCFTGPNGDIFELTVER